MSPPGPHLDQAVLPRWMMVQEGGSSGKPRGHSNLKTRAALDGGVWPLLKTHPSVLCCCGLSAEMESEGRSGLNCARKTLSVSTRGGSVFYSLIKSG